LSPTFVVILLILTLVVAFALYLILNAEHIKLTGLCLPCDAAFRGANQGVERMGASRFAQSAFAAQWRLAPTADGERSA
jgi:hypothetical protein